MTNKQNCVYILECSDGTLYTGWTNDIENRLKMHNTGLGAKYTKGRLPIKLVYLEVIAERSLALSREWHIKQLSRQQKLALINNYTKQSPTPPHY